MLFALPKTENRFGHFRQKNGPGTSEDGKPKAESRKLGPARREGQGAEDRKPFLPFSQKKGPGTSEDRKPKAESRKLGPARREGQGPEDRKPKTVFAIFTKKRVRVPPKTESRGPNPESLSRPGGRGRGPKTENRFRRFRRKKRSGYLRRPKAEGQIPKAWPGPAGGAGARRPKTENRFCNFH